MRIEPTNLKKNDNEYNCNLICQSMNKTIDYSPLKENRKFYLENKAQLLKKYNEKYILLYDCKVVNSSNDGALLSEE